MEDDMPEMVEPLHAESFFSVARSGEIHERLNFEYLDMSNYYRRVLRDESLLREEIEKLVNNMQFFLDKERVEINGEKVRSQVDYCDIYLKGDSDVVSIIYIIDFAGRFTKDENVIETWLEEEEAPYDFEIIWRFPIGTRIVEVETNLEFDVYDDIISLWAMDGDEVGGYEKLVFTLPESIFDTR